VLKLFSLERALITAILMFTVLRSSEFTKTNLGAAGTAGATGASRTTSEAREVASNASRSKLGTEGSPLEQFPKRSIHPHTFPGRSPLNITPLGYPVAAT